MTASSILFTGDMVRAILDGRKTQTRRPVKPQPGFVGMGALRWEYPRWAKIVVNTNDPKTMLPPYCPYGRPGDLLWVRETWTSAGGGLWHRADCDNGPVFDVCQWPDGSPLEDTTWHPSIHMPRWACRLVLEVVSVRVERVQEITEEGAKAEGCAEFLSTAKVPWGHAHIPVDAPILSFQNLWDSIYAAKGRGWDANPWVWAVEFKVAASTLGKAQGILGAA